MLMIGSLLDLIIIGFWESVVNKLRESNFIYVLDEFVNQYDLYFFKVVGDDVLQWYWQEDGYIYVIFNDVYSFEQMCLIGLMGVN